MSVYFPEVFDASPQTPTYNGREFLHESGTINTLFVVS